MALVATSSVAIAGAIARAARCVAISRRHCDPRGAAAVARAVGGGRRRAHAAEHFHGVGASRGFSAAGGMWQHGGAAGSSAPWQALQQQGPLPPSRAREVDAACVALRESVETGDGAWFERVVGQLRAVLEEQQRRCSVAAAPPPASPSLSTGAVATAADSDVAAWLEALQLLEAAAAAPLQGGGDAAGSAEAWPWPSSSSTPATSRGSTAPGRDDRLPSSAPSALRPAPSVEPPAPSRRDDTEREAEARLAEYLALFETGGAAAAATSVPEPGGVEPRWASVLRILERAAPEHLGKLPPRGRAEEAEEAEEAEHAQEDRNANRLAQLLSRSGGGGAANGGLQDERRAVRMSRYAELLAEVDKIGNAAPGASVPPLRFSSPPEGQRRERTTAPRPTAAPASPPPPPPSWEAPASPPASASAGATRARRADLADPVQQAVGRGTLVSSLPGPADEEASDDAVLRKEDFVWSEHDFNDGEKENKRVLKRFTKEFKKMAAETPDGLRDPKLLTAALDLALACVKCYELDKADSIYRRCIGECRRRGMPWDIKCIQDMATLRCKQHRQADAAELLEELASKAPPHPATFVNLGTVYNQLRQYEKAESWFLQAINLKGGVPDREDRWNLGIAKKNQGKHGEALPMLEQALAEFQEQEPDQPVTIAKVHNSVGGCLRDAGRFEEAVEHYQRARALFLGAVGKGSPLLGGSAEGLARALTALARHEEAFEALLESLEVHATCDAVHPTPLFEHLDIALDLHSRAPESIDLSRLRGLIDAGVANLEARGQAEDGNAGLVMSRAGKALSRAGGLENSRRAAELLRRGRALIQQCHDSGEADLGHEIQEADMLLRHAAAADDGGAG